ncbi:MAG: hypothetical protein CM15mP84_10450 [Cellvibrionales bacterium]|nr:MAG: hypothetical protein CM15mP84_10450 [Cellvibrionales bacterium]
MGESGAGKTTLMNIIAGLDSVDSGEVLVDDVRIDLLNQSELTAFRRNHIGLIFQKFHLVPSLSAWDNAALQARLAGAFDRDFANHLFDMLGIDHLAIDDRASYQVAATAGCDSEGAHASTQIGIG